MRPVASHNDDELPEVSGPDEELDSEDAPLADEVAEAEAAAATTGFITDYISGKRLRATPEEVEAVQVFAQ
jgi:type I restriction enzyme M protein